MNLSDQFILSKKLLQNVKDLGDTSFSAKCPAHDDNKNSLVVTYIKNKDRLLFHCFAGCTYDSIRHAIDLPASSSPMKLENKEVKARNLSLLERYISGISFDKSLIKFVRDNTSIDISNFNIGYDNVSDCIVYIYPTRYEDKTLFKKIKYNGCFRDKDFSPVWEETKEGGYIPYYNEYKFQGSEILYIVEGEKTAFLLDAFFHKAVISTGGASVKVGRNITFFENKKVILIPDNDFAGKQWLSRFKDNFAKGSVNYLVLNLNLEFGFFPKGTDIGDLIVYALQQPDLYPNYMDKILFVLDKKESFLNLIDKDRNQVLSWDSIKNVAYVPDFIIDPIINRGTLNAIVGPPDMGKSVFSRFLLCHLVNGLNFLNFAVPRPFRCLYISTEDLENSVRFVFSKQLSFLCLDNVPFGLSFLFFKDEVDEDIIDTIEEHIVQSGVDVIVVDTFSDIYKGKDISDNQAIRRSLRPFYNFCIIYKVTFIFIHHVSKSQYKISPSQEGVLGGASFVAKCRSVFDLRDDPNGNNKIFTIIKGNHISRAIKNKPYELFFDESFFSFSSLGLKSAVSSVPSGFDWINNINDSNKSSEIVKFLCNEYNISHKTAYNWIKSALGFGLLKKHGNQYLKSGVQNQD